MYYFLIKLQKDKHFYLLFAIFLSISLLDFFHQASFLINSRLSPQPLNSQYGCLKKNLRIMNICKTKKENKEENKQKQKWGIMFLRFFHLQNAFWQHPIVLFSDLGFVGGPIENRWVVINIIDMYDNGCVIFVQVVRCHKSQFILHKFSLFVSQVGLKMLVNTGVKF